MKLIGRHHATNANGEALTNLAAVFYSKGDVQNASDQLESALKIFQNHPKGEARVRLFKGYIAGSIGETDKAVAEIYEALKLYREINDKSGEGLALTAMGMGHARTGQGARELKCMTKREKSFAPIGDQHGEAITLNSIAQAYEFMK